MFVELAKYLFPSPSPPCVIVYFMEESDHTLCDCIDIARQWADQIAIDLELKYC